MKTNLIEQYRLVSTQMNGTVKCNTPFDFQSATEDTPTQTGGKKEEDS